MFLVSADISEMFFTDIPPSKTIMANSSPIPYLSFVLIFRLIGDVF